MIVTAVTFMEAKNNLNREVEKESGYITVYNLEM